MPDTRRSITEKVQVGMVKLLLTVGFDEAGVPREMFSKVGDGHQGQVDGLCILVSLCLQYDVPVGVLVKHLRHRKYAPEGIAGQPCSLSDAVGMVLEKHAEGIGSVEEAA